MAQQLINLITTPLSISTGLTLTDNDITAPWPLMGGDSELLEHSCLPTSPSTLWFAEVPNAGGRVPAEVWSSVWTLPLWQLYSS